MKKILFGVCMAVWMMTGPLAFAVGPSISEQVGPGGVSADLSSEIQILDMKAMAALDDQKLVDNYIDVVVEIEGTKMFYATSGFTPKAYKKYKEILKYRLQLLFEIHRRKIEIPAEIR